MNPYNKITLLILDCDGVLTDGKIYYDDHLAETKAFNVKDGLGLKLLKFTNIEVAVITGRKSELLAQRCRDLSIKHLYQKVRNKLKCADSLRKKLGLEWDQIAYVGDDWNDYPVIQKVAISASPQDAFDDFKDKVDFVCKRKGGDGAIREFIIHILKEQNRYDQVLADFYNYLTNL